MMKMLFKKIFGAVHTSLKNEVFETFAIKEENACFYKIVNESYPIWKMLDS